MIPCFVDVCLFIQRPRAHHQAITAMADRHDAIADTMLAIHSCDYRFQDRYAV